MPMTKQTQAIYTGLLITTRPHHEATQPMAGLANTQAEARCNGAHINRNQLEPYTPKPAPLPWHMGGEEAAKSEATHLLSHIF